MPAPSVRTSERQAVEAAAKILGSPLAAVVFVGRRRRILPFRPQYLRRHAAVPKRILLIHGSNFRMAAGQGGPGNSPRRVLYLVLLEMRIRCSGHPAQAESLLS